MSETGPPPLDGIVETPGPDGVAARASFRHGVLHGPLQ